MDEIVNNEETLENIDTGVEKEDNISDFEREDLIREKKALEMELEAERKMRRLSENRLYCSQLLKKHALPESLRDYLTLESEEEMEKIVADVAKIVKKAINDEIFERLATIPTPTEGKNSMTREEFKNLSLIDMQKLYKTDKELYKELSKNI